MSMAGTENGSGTLTLGQDLAQFSMQMITPADALVIWCTSRAAVAERAISDSENLPAEFKFFSTTLSVKGELGLTQPRWCRH